MGFESEGLYLSLGGSVLFRGCRILCVLSVCNPSLPTQTRGKNPATWWSFVAQYADEGLVLQGGPSPTLQFAQVPLKYQ